MAYKVFTNGSVLNASEINDNLMNQSVMVFSNSAARTAAITSPVEGMLTWLQDLNQYQYYNGSTWVLLVAETGISLLNTTSFTGIGFIDITSVFTADYQNYEVVLNIDSVSTSLTPYIQLLSGSTPAAANYSRAAVRTYSIVTAIESATANSVSTLGLGLSDASSAARITIYDPQIARVTKFAFSHVGLEGSNNLNFTGTGRHTTASSYNGLRVGAGTGNITGTVRIYGIRN